MAMLDLVRNAPGYRLVKRGETPKETARNIYDVALSVAGLPEDEDQRNGVVMTIRAAGFLTALREATKIVESEIHEDLGLLGGASGSASLADIQHLSTDEALRLHNITAAVKELESMAPDMLQIIRQYITETEEQAA